MANLDTELRTLLLQKEFFEQNPSAGKLLIGADEPLYISVKFTGDIAVLERAGFKVGSIFVESGRLGGAGAASAGRVDREAETPPAPS